MENDKFIINVQIGGWKYPLEIFRKDEERYRTAEKLLTKRIETYRRKYNKISNEELFVLVAYDLACDVVEKNVMQDIVPLANKIQELDKELDNLLVNSNNE